MTHTVPRRALLVSMLVLLAGAWLLAVSPALGRRLCPLCDPAEVEELLESGESGFEYGPLVRLPAILRPCRAGVFPGRSSSRSQSIRFDGKRDPFEYLVGHCQVTRAPPWC